MNTGTVPTQEIKLTLENIRGEQWSNDDVNGITWSNDGQVIFRYTADEDDNEIHLIANAPTWLRSLLEERSKLLEALTRIAEQTEDEITEDYARSILSQYAKEGDESCSETKQ